MVYSFTVCSVVLWLAGLAAVAQENQAIPDAELVNRGSRLGIKFDQYQTTDALGRRITFYLTPINPKEPPKPLVIWSPGSGCTSLFFKPSKAFKEQHGIPLELDMVIGKMQDFLHGVAKGRVHIMCVEKVGVDFLDSPESYGTAEDASREFLQEHTIDRWVLAIEAAYRSIEHLPEIDGSRLLLAGHSEGANTSAHLLTRIPSATHVGFLAGTGGNQIYDLPELARNDPKGGQSDLSEPDEAAYEKTLNEFQMALNDPENIEDFLWGHPYRYWATFGAHSTLEDLKPTQARIFLAYGTKDQATTVTGNDFLRAELIALKKDLTVKRIVGGDHGFTVASKKDDHMADVLNSMIEWFLADPAGVN